MTSPLQELMAKKVDRKQFLLHSGSVVLTVVGVSGLIRALTNPTAGQAGGYGSSTYGGSRRSQK